MEPRLYTTLELFRETVGCGKESPRAGRYRFDERAGRLTRQ